jgi:hypothetical protein
MRQVIYGGASSLDNFLARVSSRRRLARTSA